MATTTRIGCGSAYAEDRIDLAVDMVERGGVQYLCMDGLAERTLALAHQRGVSPNGYGYDVRLPRIVEELLPPALSRGVTIIGNVGAGDPGGAAEFVSREAKRRGFKQEVRVGLIEGDDVTEYVERTDPVLLETTAPASELARPIIAANAYIGAEPLVDALRDGANVVIGGRIADPSLFLAPLMAEFDWSGNDWELLGAGTAIAHLLECGNHVTGGNFADPPYRVVQSFRRPSLPLAEVNADGAALISKLPDTDGLLNVETCKMQLGYEIHDPKRYLTPDVTADFSEVRLVSADQGVAVSGASGTARPDQIKVLVAIDGGYIAEGQVSFAGPGALSRAQLGEQIVRERLDPLLESGEIDELRIDFLGLNSMFGEAQTVLPDVAEVHLRVAARCAVEAVAHEAADACWYLQVFGPAATGGHRKTVRPTIGLYTCFMPRTELNLSTRLI
jgi:hypothetical protein